MVGLVRIGKGRGNAVGGSQMNVLKMISFLVVLTFAAGCGKKEAVESEKQPEEKPGQERTDTVHLSDESLKLVTIDTITVAQGALNLSLRAPGRISFNLNHTAKVSSTFEGRIVKMNYDVGAEVHEGDTMALIDSPDFLNQALELKAPLSGEVVERQGTPGELVDKGKELYTVSDLAKVWVVANVNADDIAAVHVGQPATLQTMAYPDETFTGKVALVSPEVQEKSRSVEIRIEADNQDAKLKPGLFANVEIATSTL